MKNNLIISLLTLILSVSVVAAATTDFTTNGNVTVSSVLGGSDYYELLIMDGSSAASVGYDASGWLTVTDPDSTATFKVGSANSSVASIRVDKSSLQVACADNTTAGTSYVTLPTTSGVYTVYPSTNACVTANPGTGGSPGGGGAKKKKEVKTLPATPATPSPAAPALANASPNAVFNRALDLGSEGEDVKNLQKVLNANGFMIAASGLGSVGNETTYFGALTKAAVVKFQLANGLIASAADPAAGFVGPKTRAKLAELSGISATLTSVTTPVADTQALIQNLQSQLNQLLEQLQQLQNAAATQ